MKIRRRDRIQSSPPRGQSQEWLEYQVLDGRKVIARYGTLEAAIKDYPDAEIDALKD